MPSTQRAGIPYPSGTDVPYAAADMQALAETLDRQVVLRAADAADRDAKYLEPTPGMLVVADDSTTWVADSQGGWHTVYRPDPPWAGCSMLPGNYPASGQPEGKKLGNQVWLRGGVGHDNGVQGDFAYVPSGMEPPDIVYLSAPCSLGGDRTYSSVRLGIGPDGNIYVSGDQDPSEVPPAWVGLDNIVYWVD